MRHPRLRKVFDQHPQVAILLAILAIALLLTFAELWIAYGDESSTPQERLWTLVAILALLFTCWTVDDNIQNYHALLRAIARGRAVRYGPRWWFAVSSIVSSFVMYVVWLGFACIGIIALNVGPEDPQPLRETVGHFTGYALVILTVGLAFIQVWQVWTRHKIRALPWFMGDDLDERSTT